VSKIWETISLNEIISLVMAFSSGGIRRQNTNDQPVLEIVQKKRPNSKIFLQCRGLLWWHLYCLSGCENLLEKEIIYE